MVPSLSYDAGAVTATPGQQMVRSSVSLLGEIRRGEAVQVGDSWYRVGSAIGSGAAGEQVQRAAAPASVTADRDMSERNVYCDPYTAELLPLDGDYEGAEVGPIAAFCTGRCRASFELPPGPVAAVCLCRCILVQHTGMGAPQT
jgi:hypothetical protein